ncbi:hypothetical protein NC653_015997 [Populus alba x Populus x berolinensis]|uniref:HMA domain-containing protein n=1 Tax=Populus alba x Populus x berolinensis TaxID=444605 RepID=A0AAD6VYX1_9ROSI|nr:hypothetical protein NC653_015997 [Populus alba x Populus x berolinensis]
MIRARDYQCQIVNSEVSHLDAYKRVHFCIHLAVIYTSSDYIQCLQYIPCATMKKTVLKVNINCMKCKKELMKTVAKNEGIDQIAINCEKGTMIVVGIVDPVVLVNKLRKAGKVAAFISVGPYKKEDMETEKPKDHHNFPSCCKQCEVVAIGFPAYYPDLSPCSIL